MCEGDTVSKLQSEVERLYILTNNIRNGAINGEYYVDRRKLKHPDWKNKLLSLVSDEVVINHLKYLHPFQYRGATGSLNTYVYVINFYHFNIYLKVNTRDRKVISFHYDETPGIIPKLSESFEEDFEDGRVMVITENNSGYDTVMRFAVGSDVITSKEQYSVYRDGSTYITTEQLKSILDNHAERVANKLYKRISNYDSKLTDILDVMIKDYNFLTFVDESKELQLISFCYDLWLKDKEKTWLKDMALDLLMSYPEHLQKQFISQLYKTKQDYPILITDEFK